MDQAYKTVQIVFQNHGLVARYAEDRAPDQYQYLNLLNLECRQENALSSRYGLSLIGTPAAGTAVHSLGRLKSLSGTTHRFAGAGTKLYQRTGDTAGAYTDITSTFVLSGNPWQQVVYRPELAAAPYAYFFDGNVALSYSDGFSVAKEVGIDPPTLPPTLALASPVVDTVLGVTSSTLTSSFIFTNITSPVVYLLPGGGSNYAIGGNIAASTTGTIEYDIPSPPLDLSVISGNPQTQEDQFTVSAATALLWGPLGNFSGATLQFSSGDTTFTNYFTADFPISGGRLESVSRSDFTQVGNANWANIYAWRWILSTNSNSGSDTLNLHSITISSGAVPDVTGGVPYDYRYTWYNANTGTESNPCPVMATPNYASPVNQAIVVNWYNAPTDPQVTHTRLYRRGGSISSGWFQVAQIAAATTTYTDQLPDSYVINQNQLQLDSDPPVTSALVTPITATLSAGVTKSSASGTTTATYTPATPAIVKGQVVTVGAPGSEEVLIPTAVGTGTFTAHFQLNHSSGDPVMASTNPRTGVNLAAIAYDTAWAAGDANNPSTLYYSRRFNPEAWPPENTLEIGPPSDPIVGVYAWRGQLYVQTLTQIYQVLGGGTDVPFALVTATIHGLAASNGVALAEGEVFYQGIDGKYIFSGAASQLLTEVIDWIETGKNLGPVVAMDQTKRSQVRAAFCDNEIYFSYVGTDAVQRRVIFHTIYRRWRNDSVPATAMLYEADTGVLVIGEAGGGVYHDRVGDNDAGTGFTIDLQTQLMDFGNIKAEKVFNELTLDINTNGQNLTFNIYYDTLASVGDTFTVNTASRQQVQFALNSGLGWRARRIAFEITGSVSSVVDIFQLDVRAVLEAENRKSFDTWQMTFGSHGYKIVKQAYFVYEAPSAAVTVDCYVEGSDVAAFSFTLPQTASVSDAQTNTLSRTSLKIRFPALKAKVWRFVGTCTGDFKMLAESWLETKDISSEKGYSRHPFAEASQT